MCPDPLVLREINVKVLHAKKSFSLKLKIKNKFTSTSNVFAPKSLRKWCLLFSK